MRLAVLLVVLTCAHEVWAGDAIERASVVARVDGGTWSDAPTEARIDQKVELAAIVHVRRGKQRIVLVPAEVESLTLAGRKVSAKQLARLDVKEVRWWTVEPHGFRESKAKNGATSDFYSNVSTESKTFGKWLGYDTIEYFEHNFAAKPEAISSVGIKSSEPDAMQVPGIGTMRFKAALELADGTTVETPGAEATDTFGILPSVHRVSIRKSDDFIGWLGAYLLVPEVFGSAGPGTNHQTERFTGADCADVMIGAMRRTGKKLAYTKDRKSTRLNSS